MIDIIKIYWKLILIGIISLILIISTVFLSIQLSRSTKKNERDQIELIEQQYKFDLYVDSLKQIEFERNMEQSDLIIEQELKKHEELKERIKNPGIDFSNDVIQDSINSEYNRRFP